MTEEIPMITAKCLQNLKAIVPVKDRTREQELTHEWEFEVTSARVQNYCHDYLIDYLLLVFI